MQRATFIVTTFVLGMTAPPAPAHANDLGCQVLLCLSNPGGATQYAQCVAPMTKLWQRLATGGAFPVCSGGGVSGTKVYDRNSSTRRRVVMTFANGSRQSYSLAGIDRLPGGAQ